MGVTFNPKALASLYNPIAKVIPTTLVSFVKGWKSPNCPTTTLDSSKFPTIYLSRSLPYVSLSMTQMQKCISCWKLSFLLLALHQPPQTWKALVQIYPEVIYFFNNLDTIYTIPNVGTPINCHEFIIHHWWGQWVNSLCTILACPLSLQWTTRWN